MPPMTRPMNEPAIAATPLMPSASPRWWAGNASVRIALEFANSIAPPMPCTTRMPMSHSAALLPAMPCPAAIAEEPQRGARAGHPRHREQRRAECEDREAEVVHAHAAVDV